MGKKTSDSINSRTKPHLLALELWQKKEAIVKLGTSLLHHFPSSQPASSRKNKWRLLCRQNNQRCFLVGGLLQKHNTIPWI